MPDDVDKDYSERNDDVMNFQVRRLNVTLLFKLNILVSISHIQKQTHTHTKIHKKQWNNTQTGKQKLRPSFINKEIGVSKLNNPLSVVFFHFSSPEPNV